MRELNVVAVPKLQNEGSSGLRFQKGALLLIALYGEPSGRSAVRECVSVLVRAARSGTHRHSSVYLDTTNRLLLQSFCIFATTRDVRT
jgi:hypothetical protein